MTIFNYILFFCYGGSLEVGQLRSFIYCQSLSNSTSFESYPSSEHVPSVVFYINPKRATQILFCLPSPLSSQTLLVKTSKMKIRREICYSKIYLKWRSFHCLGMYQLHKPPTPEYKYLPKKNMTNLNLVQKLLHKTQLFQIFMSGAFK